MIQYAPINSDI